MSENAGKFLSGQLRVLCGFQGAVMREAMSLQGEALSESRGKQSWQRRCAASAKRSRRRMQQAQRAASAERSERKARQA